MQRVRERPNNEKCEKLSLQKFSSETNIALLK